MRWRFLIPLFAVLFLLFPGGALAQGSSSSDDLLLRVNGPINVAAGQEYGNVVVIRDRADVAGVVRHELVVVDGDAMVTGTVEGNVTVVKGTLTLGSSARVTGDVDLINSDLTQASGATIQGKINKNSYNWSGWQLFAFSVYVWISVTIALIIAGLIFAAVGGRQLMAAGALMVRQTGMTIVAALVVGIGIPILAVLAMATILGIPLGLGLLIFLIPALWFFGYLTAGTKLGAVILRQQTSNHPYLAAALGILLLQVIGLIPFIGGLIDFLAGIFGTGALVLLAWHAWRGPGTSAPAQMRLPEPTAGD